MDDTCLWSDTLEGIYLKTCQYLTLCFSKGIVFNMDKFQFGCKTVNFVGFTVTEDLDVMLPFCHLLKPGETFVWDQNLEEAFNRSKEVLLEAVKDGVKTFDLSRKTSLATDWSKQGIGFILLQKTCSCPKVSPDCCPGWVVTFCGSRFLTGPETRYSPGSRGPRSSLGSGENKTFCLGVS